LKVLPPHNNATKQEVFENRTLLKRHTTGLLEMGVAQSGLNFESSNHNNCQQILWKSPNFIQTRISLYTFGKLPLAKMLSKER